MAICTIPGHSGTSISGFLYTKLSNSLVWFLDILSKCTKGLSLLVDCSARPTGMRCIAIVNGTCDIHVVCIGCNQHLDMVSNFSHKGCYGN